MRVDPISSPLLPYLSYMESGIYFHWVDPYIQSDVRFPSKLLLILGWKKGFHLMAMCVWVVGGGRRGFGGMLNISICLSQR